MFLRAATASARIGNPNLFANIARFAIIGFAALIALEQLLEQCVTSSKMSATQAALAS
jgi:uncharacterized membrane protein YuzA (DUF378 family)